MEPYLGFSSHDFENDARFQKGLKTLNITGETQENILKMKIFYYNRFVQPIDLEGYRKWQSARTPQSDRGEQACSSPHRDVNPQTLQETPWASDPTSATQPRSPDAEGSLLSFAEVFQLIQCGKEVPGLQKLNISPCQQSPTVSQMSRRPKPWEGKS
uniref:Uncharacterized protein n=1 Tax=Lepisosteus oculatus TaxID=7918 RepID=W5MEE7_LEPOC